MGRACQQSFRTGAADRKAIEKKRVSRFHRPGTPSSMRKCIYSPHTFPRVAWNRCFWKEWQELKLIGPSVIWTLDISAVQNLLNAVYLLGSVLQRPFGWRVVFRLNASSWTTAATSQPTPADAFRLWNATQTFGSVHRFQSPGPEDFWWTWRTPIHTSVSPAAQILTCRCLLSPVGSAGFGWAGARTHAHTHTHTRTPMSPAKLPVLLRIYVTKQLLV